VGKAEGASLSGIKGRIRALPALVQDALLQSLRHDIPLMKNLALGEAAGGCKPTCQSTEERGSARPSTAKITVKKESCSVIMAPGHQLLSYKYY
jgi:hypothetical protein